MSLDLGNIPIGTPPNLTQQQQMRTALVAAGNAPSNGEKYVMRDGQWVYLIEASRAYDSANNILLTEPRNIIPDNWASSYSAAIASVDFKSTLTSIGSYAFESCTDLTSVTIPNSVTSIENYAFYTCTSLTNVTIGNNVTSIGSYAFYFCTSLTSVTIPNSVTSIGNSAFNNCFSLESVIIGSGASIGSNAFYACPSLTEITVSPLNLSYSSVGGVLFDKDKTAVLQYPEGKPELTYSIPSSVISLSGNAFVNCSNLTSMTIPNNVTSIGSAVFYNCTSLTSVTIGSGITYISGQAFFNCISLNYLACLATNAPTLPIGDSVFTNVPTTVIHVPIGATGYDTYFDGLSVLYDI